MLLKIHPENPSQRQINTVVECLADGGIIIYPTDTVYGLACDIFKTKAVDRIALLKGTKKEKANFTFVFHDLSQISDYTKPFSTEVFRLMKNSLPGPYTFILNANSNIPRIFHSRKKTVGIRIPQNKIPIALVRELGNPIMTTSIRDDDEIIEYTSDPELIYEKYKNLVDMVIDGGYGDNRPSTIIDCTGAELLVVREGKGSI
ncbi:MAG: L-threonylcarbamoyladenylate synthase [Bacteroidales bacterium]|nr:L-threonylcarbamoyladenylate synthase [Bacteroidales bacterium]MDZ4205555.1 L-threonylcarbamoyladenylate synthase [Bacteroidales bacterium]